MTDPTTQLDATLSIFGRLGIPVRREKLGGSGGGLCVVRGERVLFVDVDADVGTQVDRCVAALAMIPEVDRVYLVPTLRERVDHLKKALPPLVGDATVSRSSPTGVT